MAKQYKLDLFKLLSNISKNNAKYYETLSEEEIKEISPLVIMRWLSGSNDLRQITFLNELVNPFVFSLAKNHKKLLIRLMTLCTSGKDRRYKFNRVKSKKNTKMPKAVAVIKQIFGYNTLQALEVLPMISNEDILSFAEQLGRQKPEITIIKKEIKTRQA